MKRIELKDVFKKPSPKDFGFKSNEDYYKIKQISSNRSKISNSLYMPIGIILTIANLYFIVYNPFLLLLTPVLFIVLITIDGKMTYPDNLAKYNLALSEYERIINIKDKAILFYNDIENKIKRENMEDKMIWPTFNYETNIDAIIIKEMAASGFRHELVIKVLDDMVLPNIYQIDDTIMPMMVLSWLQGTGAISEEEVNMRINE